MDSKGFNAEVLVSHGSYAVGDVVYMKAVEFKFSTPALFAILDKRNGECLEHVDGNEFKNRFKKI